MSLVTILSPSQVKRTGWYWWRAHGDASWRIEYFDLVNRPHQLRVMGGEFIGPLAQPNV